MFEWALSHAHARVHALIHALIQARLLLRFVVATAALVMYASAASAQVGSTTDLVIGRVLGPDTLPLKHARVTVTSVESGITRTTATNDEGRYTVVFPDGGGKYVVTAQYLGMFPTRTMVARQADEDRLVANFQLAESPVILQAIRVLAAQIGDTALASAGANGKVISRDLLDRLGYLNDDAAAIAMITPGVNFTPGSDTSLSALSIGGQAPTQTKTSVDGVKGGASLPREAVRNTSVVTSDYDVSEGGFTGGFINQQTISGTNTLRASVNTGTPLAPIGQAPSSGILLMRQTGADFGGDVSGPLRKDHLFFAGAFHTRRMHSPVLSAYSLSPEVLARVGVAPDSLARFLDILASHGVVQSTGSTITRATSSQNSGFGRIDYTPNEHNTLTLSANSMAWTSAGFGYPLSTTVGGGEFLTHSSRAFVSLTSNAGAWVNDARMSASWTRSGVHARVPGANGYVVVPSAAADATTPAIQTFSFGGYGGGNSITRATAVEAKDEVSRLSGDGAHRIKAGVDITLTHSTGGLPSNVYGSYTFQSLADLESGQPASYSRTLAPADRRSGVTDAGVYLGDAWRIGPQMQLVYGARLDQATFLDAPALNSAALARFGIRTDHFPSESGVSPRIGFTYLPHARQGKQPIATIRGGIGIFRSAGSDIAETFAAARDATGLQDATAYLSCVGAAVPPIDWDEFVNASTPAPDACAGASSIVGASAAPSVTLIDPSLHVPRTVRASLSIAKTLHQSWNVTLEGSLTNGSSQSGVRDINLALAPRFTLANEDNRPVYASPSAIVPSTGAVPLAASRLDSGFGVVKLASSTLHNRDRSISLSVNHHAQKLSFNASYTRSWSRTEVYALTPASGGIFYGGPPAATAGDPRASEWERNPWSPPQSVRVFASYSPATWMSITPSFFMMSGSRFDPRVAGDVNGDGAANDLAFVFDPAHTTDTTIANGMQRLLATAPARARDCLASQLGHIASLQSCDGPWFMNMGLSVQLTPPWRQKRLTLSLQTSNLISGADLLLHGPERLHGWGQFYGGDNNLLFVRGFDPATQEYKYAVNERFGISRPNQTYSINPFQLMLSARINLGAASGPIMMMGGPPGANPGAAKGGMSADTLHARLARTVPNPFRRTIELKDSLSLALDSTQLAKLKMQGDAFQVHADSIITKLAAIMSAPLIGPGAVDVAARVRTETDAGQTLEKGAIADLRSILTDAQFAKLPASVTKPAAPAPPPAPAKSAVPAKSTPPAPTSH